MNIFSVNSTIRGLKELILGQNETNKSFETNPEHRLLFVFQGRQGYRVGMGRELYHAEPVFRQTAKLCSEVIEERQGIKLVDAFSDDRAAELVHQNEFHSILIHAVIHLSLSALWASRGIKPDGTIGLSLGEITSPFISGALSLKEVMSVARSAAQWDERVLERGKILELKADLALARQLSAECPVNLEHFAEYGPTTNEMFSTLDDLDDVIGFLDLRRVKHRVYRGDYAYHTPRFANCKDIMTEDLAFMKPKPAKNDFYSSLSGELISTSTYFDSDYWYWMLAKGVLFNTALEAAMNDGYDTFVNIGPRPALKRHIQEAADKLDKQVNIIDSMRDEESEVNTFERSYNSLRELGFGNNPGSKQKTIREVTLPSEINADNFELDSAEVLQNPYPFYEKLRKQGPIHFFKRHNFWLVLDYSDVEIALKQPEIFSSKPARGLDPVLLAAEPLDHERARRLLSPFFTREAINDLRGYVESIVEDLLGEVDKKEEFDVVGEFAIPLTEEVIAHFIGLDHSEKETLRQQVGANKYDLDYYRILDEYFAGYLQNIEERPRGLFANRLLAGDGNDRFSKDEVASLLKLFWVAGTTTTSMLISTSVHQLLHHPHIKFEIQENFDLIPMFIEESLRLDAPEQTAWRTTTSETLLGGTKIPEGAEIRLCLAAANRDPKRYRNPDSLVLKRNPKNHLSFGLGNHFCLGATLARLEAGIAIKAILTHYPHLRSMQRINEARYVRSAHFRALEKLIVSPK